MMTHGPPNPAFMRCGCLLLLHDSCGNSAEKCESGCIRPLRRCFSGPRCVRACSTRRSPCRAVQIKQDLFSALCGGMEVREGLTCVVLEVLLLSHLRIAMSEACQEVGIRVFVWAHGNRNRLQKEPSFHHRVCLSRIEQCGMGRGGGGR